MSRNEKRNQVRCTSQEIIIARTNTKGKIIYYNPTFSKIHGIEGGELIHESEELFRHPDMPKAIFKIVSSILEQGLSIQAVVKNKTLDGKYYWSLVSWEAQRDVDDEIISFVMRGKQAPDKVINIMEPLYKIMTNIEEEHGIESSLAFLHAHLDEEKVTYSQYMNTLTKNREFRCLCDFVTHSILGKS